MFTAEELAKLERAFGEKPSFKTSTGFTGNKKSKKDRERWVVGKKRRQTDHLSNKDRKKLAALHQQVDELLVANSFVQAKSDEKLTKKDMRKGGNSNLGAYGIHGSKTFLKYKSISKTFVKYCFEQYHIDHISEIKTGMYLDWMEDKMKNGQPNGEKYSGKTISLYGSGIKKLAESGEVAGGEFQRLSVLGEQKITDKVTMLKERYDAHYSKKDYKRGKSREDKEGKKRNGYSYKEAQKIAKKASEMSPYYGTMYEVLSVGCPRLDELRGIKWRQIDTENNRIYMSDPNQTKGSRPRWIPISEKTSAKIQSMMDLGYAENPDTRVWGSRMTEDDIYNLTRHLCREAHVGYSGVHDFRRAAVEHHQKQIEKELKKENTTREDLEKRFLEYVNSHPQLNPVETKFERKRDEDGNIVYKQVTDKDGNPRFYGDGRPRMQAEWVVKKDENDEIVEGPRYTVEEVAEWRIDKLINSLTSQILGHNRTDAASPYKNG